MGGFIRILVIALLIWYGVKLVVRLIFPLLVAKTKQRQQQTIKKEGDITVHYDKKHQEKFEKKEKKGDYVDYEEVK